MIELYEHQKKALPKMKNGCILVGGVGSGKSITALTYFFENECGGRLSTKQGMPDSPMKRPKPLYIITTARKRDSLEWDGDAIYFGFSPIPELSIVPYKVDSWNNIHKYEDVGDAFFIFDEQRVVGSGAWVKSFLKITQRNRWILLSATPGDTWMDYIPVFVAHGFYRNRTDFIRQHVVYSRYAKFPKVEKYVDCGVLARHKNDILVYMPFVRSTRSELEIVPCSYDTHTFMRIFRGRWNPYEDRPIQQAGEWCHLMRRVVNSDPDRLARLRDICIERRKVIVFYNFDYELMTIRDWLGEQLPDFERHEYNGHKHEPVPDAGEWVYLVQYTAGSEAWNCITTDTIIFYSLNYSYKIMEQAAGRINRLNTPFNVLHYYILCSPSPIDKSIRTALRNKKQFNENKFITKNYENVRRNSDDPSRASDMSQLWLQASSEEARIAQKYGI